MICNCDPPVQCAVQISRSEKNYNREFFKCVNPRANCDFFQWVDAPIGGARRQRQAVPVISTTGNKPQIIFSVAEMTLGDVDEGCANDGHDVAETTQSPSVWINIMVILKGSYYVMILDNEMMRHVH